MCTMLTNKYMPSLCITYYFNVWINTNIQVNRNRLYHDGFISEKWPVVTISIDSCFCYVHKIPTNVQSDIANYFSVNINLSTFKLIALSCCVCFFLFFYFQNLFCRFDFPSFSIFIHTSVQSNSTIHSYFLN